MTAAPSAADRPYDLILRNARLLLDPDDATPAFGDLAVRDGAIAQLWLRDPGDRPSGPAAAATAARELDAEGRLASPPFVESHIHLDSARTAGEPRWNQSGTLFEGIQIWGERKRSLTAADVETRAIAALKELAAQGVLFVRSHADVSEPSLAALKGLLAARDRAKDWTTLQVVAFPQDGLYGHPDNERLLERALDLGADVVGGIPHYELTREDGTRSVRRLFELAQKYDRPLDLHCDEIDDPQSRFLEVMAACTLRADLGSRVTASHTCAFASYANGYANKLMGLLQRAGLNLVANPAINLTLQGRTDSYPKRRGITRVKELWQAGINVSLGSDCLQDPWYPLGTGHLLDAAYLAVHGCQMTGRAEIDACYAMTTTHGAKTLGLGTEDYGLAAGRPANFAVLDADSRYDAVRRRAIARYVVSRGRLLAETTPVETRWSDGVGWD